MSKLEGVSEVFVPHIGWLQYPAEDLVLRHLREGSFEFHEQAFLWSFLREDDIFLDIGAHCGLFSALASQILAANKQIHAFEPNPEIIPLLRMNTDVGSVQIHPVAIGNASGQAELWQGAPSDSAMSSLVYEVPGGKRSTVQITTLDEFLSGLGKPPIAFAKLDVEGSEVRAIQGAESTLREKAILALFVEFTEDNLRKSGHSAVELAQLLVSHGYLPYRIASDRVGMIRHPVEGSVEYENFVFTHDVSAVEARIQSAPAERARRSDEVLSRGLASEALVKSLWENEREATARLALVNELTSAIEQTRSHGSEMQRVAEERLLMADGLQAENQRLTKECEERSSVISELSTEIEKLRLLSVISKRP